MGIWRLGYISGRGLIADMNKGQKSMVSILDPN